MPQRRHPPLQGAANNTAAVDTPELFCPPPNLRNIRIGPQPNERPRAGPRPGIIKAFTQRLGNGAPVQAMIAVGRASGISRYDPGDVTPVTDGITRLSGALSGQAWVMDHGHGMFADFGAGTAEYAYACCWHPTLRRLAYFTINGPPPIYTRVRMVDCDPDSATFLQTLWTKDLDDRDPTGSPGTFPLFGNHIIVGATFTFVSAGHWVYVIRTSDGTYLKRYSMMDWCEEAMGSALRADGRLGVIFRGSNVVTGPVTTNDADTGAANGEGSHFRAGCMLFTVDTTKTAVNDDMLTPVQFGAKKDALYTYYEDHLYFRLSEHIASQPRGKYPNSIAATPDGGFVVGTCNKGWGPNNTFRPDDSVAPRALLTITPGTVAAAIGLELDFRSRLDPRVTLGLTDYNDIPHPSDAVNNTNDPHPSADAVCVDPTGHFYVGGRSAFGFSVRKMDKDTGEVIWEQNTGDWVPQHGIAFNQPSNLVAVVGKRNTTWEGSSGGSAVLWWLAPDTGEIVDHFDLGFAANAWGVTCNAFGDTAFVSDYVT